MSKSGIWNAAFIQLLVFELLSQLGVALVNPITSNFAVALGAAVATGGFLAGLNPLTSLIVRPLGGFLLGLASRKRLLVITSVVFMTSSLICAAFPSLVSLGVSRVLLGVAYVVKSSIVVALAAFLIPRECVGQGVAYTGLANVVANAIGPTIASAVGLAVGYRFSFALSAALFIVSLVLLALLKIPDSPAEKTSSQGLFATIASLRKNGIRSLVYFKTLPITCLGAFTSYLFGTVTSLLLLVGEERGIENISLFFVAFAITSCLARPIAGKLNDTYGLSKTLYPEAVIMCASCLCMAFAQNLLAFLAGAVLLALGQGCLFPSLQAESVRNVDDEHSSLAANTFFFGPDMGMSIGPIISGIVLQAFGSTAMFLVCFGISVIFIFTFYCFDRTRR